MTGSQIMTLLRINSRSLFKHILKNRIAMIMLILVMGTGSYLGYHLLFNKNKPEKNDDPSTIVANNLTGTTDTKEVESVNSKEKDIEQGTEPQNFNADTDEQKLDDAKSDSLPSAVKTPFKIKSDKDTDSDKTEKSVKHPSTEVKKKPDVKKKTSVKKTVRRAQKYIPSRPFASFVFHGNTMTITTNVTRSHEILFIEYGDYLYRSTMQLPPQKDSYKIVFPDRVMDDSTGKYIPLPNQPYANVYYINKNKGREYKEIKTLKVLNRYKMASRIK